MAQMAIDHDQRRDEIATITIDLVAREGIEAASIRRIAAEGGFSTTAITHYFADKQDLLIGAFEKLSREGELRFEDSLARNAADRLAPLMTMVPWCAANVRRWKAYLAFWDAAARDRDLALALKRSTRVGLAYLRRLLLAEGVAEAKLDKIAELLNAFIQGLALQMLVDETHWDEQKVRAALGEALALSLLRAQLSERLPDRS